MAEEYAAGPLAGLGTVMGGDTLTRVTRLAEKAGQPVIPFVSELIVKAVMEAEAAGSETIFESGEVRTLAE